jgi:hypothetical protein
MTWRATFARLYRTEAARKQLSERLVVDRNAHERQLAEENNRYFMDVALAGQQGRDVKVGSGGLRPLRQSSHCTASRLDLNVA